MSTRQKTDKIMIRISFTVCTFFSFLLWYTKRKEITFGFGKHRLLFSLFSLWTMYGSRIHLHFQKSSLSINITRYLLKEFHPDRVIVYCLYIESGKAKKKWKITVQSGIECTIKYIWCYVHLLPLLFLSYTVSCVCFIFFMPIFVILLVREYDKQFIRTLTLTHTLTQISTGSFYGSSEIVNDPSCWLWFKVILSKIAVKKQIKI